jgi:ribonuclease HII
VVAAAVILAPDFPELGINDSKLLSGAGREAVFHRIEQTAVAVGIGIVEPDVIDRINILQATRAAMVKAVHAITPPPDYLLIDGPIALDLTLAQQSVIHGDRISFSIAAAGIMAKVTRDRIMEDLDRRYPGYGFASHKGYPTSAHKEAIVRLGPCPVHRRCFRGVKEHCPIG